MSWTKESRERQRQRIAEHKPWEKSTGAKTSEGKQCSSQNANKGKGHLRNLRKKIAGIHRERLEILRWLEREYAIIIKI